MRSEAIKLGAKAVFPILLVASMLCAPSLTHPQEGAGHTMSVSSSSNSGELPAAMTKVRIESEILLYDARELRREVDAMCLRTCGSVSTTSRAEARR